MQSEKEQTKESSEDENFNFDVTNKKLLPDSCANMKKMKSKGILAQCLVTGAVMLTSAGCGMPIGYSAILLPQLKSMNGTLEIDDNIGSWIASVHSAATPLGSLLSGILMERCGRKLALQISAIPLVIGWMLIGFAHNHCLLLLGRLIAGTSAGLSAAPGQVLIGEISEPHVRGLFTSVPFASYSFGILLVYALGSWLNWRLVAGLSTTIPLLAAAVFLLLPESPAWLVRKGRDEEAKQSLLWLRGGNSLQVKQELKQLVTRMDNEVGYKNKKSSWKFLFEPQILKPFIIVNVFNVMQIFSGTYLVVFYAVDILSNIGENNLDNFLAAVFTACVRFIFTVIASLLLAMIGRRALAITSGIGTGISALCLGFFLYFNSNCTNNGYFAALCILFYVALNTIGFMILPGVLIGELYPCRIRGFAGGITFTIFNIILFGVAKFFPYIRYSIGVHGVFWLFGGSSVMASIFLYIMLPETKGKSLGEIEDYFSQGNITWINREKDLPKKYKTDVKTSRV